MADSVLPSWPVILNRSLENSDIYRLLMQYHKVRVTDTTGHGVIIFPLSSVAFMIMPLDQVLTENQEKHLINEDTIERIHKLNQLHRKAYVILVAAFMGPEQIKAWTALQSRLLVVDIYQVMKWQGKSPLLATDTESNLRHCAPTSQWCKSILVSCGYAKANFKKNFQAWQKFFQILTMWEPHTIYSNYNITRFLGTSSRFIPAHSAKECFECMMTISKVTSKPMVEVIQERMERLQESTINDNIVLGALATIGLSNHECLVLQDGCKNVTGVSLATKEELLDCSLDQQTAQKIINFFEKDCIQI